MKRRAFNPLAHVIALVILGVFAVALLLLPIVMMARHS